MSLGRLARRTSLLHHTMKRKTATFSGLARSRFDAGLWCRDAGRDLL